MVNGNILLDEKGIDINNVVEESQKMTVANFCDMLDDAHSEGDTLYYIYTTPLNLYSTIYPSDKVYNIVGQKTIQRLQTAFGNFPRTVADEAEFNAQSEPKTHGGFKYDACPQTDYVYDHDTIDKWHKEWYYNLYFNHPDKINWEETNGVFPCRDKVIEILREELLDLQKHLDPSGRNNTGLPHELFLTLKNTDWTKEDGDNIVRKHNEIIIKHKGENIKAYSEKTGSLICSVNYYHRERELEKLEKEHGNKKVSIIYSIQKGDDKYQFISIDTAHGKFELCGDNGKHIAEIRFDGSPNGEDTQEDDHSLQRVEDWKKLQKNK